MRSAFWFHVLVVCWLLACKIVVSDNISLIPCYQSHTIALSALRICYQSLYQVSSWIFTVTTGVCITGLAFARRLGWDQIQGQHTRLLELMLLVALLGCWHFYCWNVTAGAEAGVSFRYEAAGFVCLTLRFGVSGTAGVLVFLL